MRNLKRALSLALASVMLLGMMVVGTSAASFSDEAEIVNKEAVEITAGLGLFAGSDGKFDPKGNVTRAQMATVIVKMLYGSSINADQFKGTGKFTDTVSFEGGWAEGYINLCANLGIVKGYGDNTFKPGNQVTTAEAVTMIINALGVDAGEGTWPLTVMSKAEEMKLFDELAVKPGTNVALTRDDLASIVLEGLYYSPAGVNGYSIPGSDIVFPDLASAVNAIGVVNGNIGDIKEVTGTDTLAVKVFDMKPVTGVITANQATGADATQIGNALYDIETGLDLLGHRVTLYYKEAYTSEDEPGLAYAVVDESKTIKVEKAITNDRIAFRTAFGTRVLNEVQINNGTVASPAWADNADLYDGTKVVTAQGSIYGYNPTAAIADTDGDQVAETQPYSAPAGEYVVYDNAIIAYVAPADVYVGKVAKVTTTAGKEQIRIGTNDYENNATLDQIVEYEGIAKDDIITYTFAGSLLYVEKAKTVSGQVTSVAQDPDDLLYSMTVGGVAYKYVNPYAINLSNTGITPGTAANLGSATGFNFTPEYTLYLTANDRLIGYSTTAAGSVDISNVIYVNHVYTTKAANAYGITTENTYAQGVDMEGKEVNILINVAKETAAGSNTFRSVLDDNADDVVDSTETAFAAVLARGTTGFYTFSKVNHAAGAKEDIQTGKAAYTSYNAADIGTAGPIYTEAGKTAPFLSTDVSKLNADTKFMNLAASASTPYAYVNAGTKYILVSGSTTNLEIGLYTGSINYDLGAQLPGGAYKVSGINMLLTKDSSGNAIAQAVVINVADIAVEGDAIYVSANQTTAKSSTADGYIFQVYNAKTGEVMDMVMETAASLTSGFWTYTYDETDKVYEINSAYDNVETGAAYVSSYNNLLVAGSLSHVDASNAIVVDTRSETQVKTDDVGTIASLDDINYLSVEEGKTVTLDIIHDADKENVIAIYVVSIA